MIEPSPTRSSDPSGPVRNRRRLDAALVGGLAALGLLALPFQARWSPEAVPIDLTGLALVLVAAAALILRRTHPVPALMVAAAATAAYLAIGYPYGPIWFSFAVAVYSIARHRPLRRSLGWALLALAATLVHLFTNDLALDGFAGVLPASAWMAVPFTIGASRRLVAEARTRERAEADRRLVDAERLRLAQEVHDVVGHGLAAIQMQADIALHIRHSHPDQAAVALAAISSASAEALTELRETLATIRPHDADSREAPRAPTPGLARLEDLCDRVRAAGVEVDLTRDGFVRALPAATDLTAYRIVQESLTNVVKHSGHPHATVSVEYGSDDIVITVTNQDLDPHAHVEGFGIGGMRRRVAELGGMLTAGPGPDPHTFQVKACIPTAVTPTTSATDGDPTSEDS
jgi:signal transduction histidine kinase